MSRVYDFLVAGFAGVIASWITYLLTLRSKRHEVLIRERLAGFKFMQAILVSLQEYLLARAGDQSGSDFAPRTTELPEGHMQGVLTHREALRGALLQSQVYLSPRARKAMQRLDRQLHGLCGLELEMAAHPEDSFSDFNLLDTFHRASTSVEEAIQSLYDDIGFPRAKAV